MCVLTRYARVSNTHLTCVRMSSQVFFAEFWSAVASRFAASPSVLGYEILNEPFLGDLLRYPSLVTGFARPLSPRPRDSPSTL